WRAGDRFRPLGAPGSAKVGDLFTNRRVPLPERAGRWVAEARDGTLCWVEGWPCGESFKVTPGTRRFLRIQLKRTKVKKTARASNG
ncbi:MAG: tRNA lysidine(34) synthetase TilS, partial [Verrucomicrobiota bacterium]